MERRQRIRSVRDLAAAVRGQRRDLALSQAELARRAGVARKTISELETSKAAPELGLMLRVLAQLGLELQVEAGSRVRATRPGAVDLDAIIAKHRGR